MSSIPSWQPRSSAPWRRAGVVVRNVVLVLFGLALGAIVGIVVAGFAGWWPRINLC